MTSKKTKISAHCIVKNEQNWIWFALNSVLPYTDEILVWDTGSTDNTVKIVKSIKNPKIIFKEVGEQDAPGITRMRSEMLEASRSDWIFNLDGDEIWPRQAILEAVQIIRRNPRLNCVISPYINLVGDIYHKLSDSQGKYHIHEFTGNYSIRFINTQIPGLKAIGRHGHESYVDSRSTSVQEFPRQTMKIHVTPYWHMTHLPRSSRENDARVIKRMKKFKYDLGQTVPPHIPIPEVFYLTRPPLVPNPFIKRSNAYILKSLLYWIPRRVKQIFF